MFNDCRTLSTKGAVYIQFTDPAPMIHLCLGAIPTNYTRSIPTFHQSHGSFSAYISIDRSCNDLNKNGNIDFFVSSIRALFAVIQINDPLSPLWYKVSFIIINLSFT